jgi:hypothetical protein
MMGVMEMESFYQPNLSENPIFTFDAHDGVFFLSWASHSPERMSLTEEALDVMMGRVLFP